MKCQLAGELQGHVNLKKMKCYEKACTSFESFIAFDLILKVDSGFPDRFLREALKEPKGEQKRGANRGSCKG